MPSAALKINTDPAEVAQLSERLRESGQAAIKISGWIPAFLVKNTESDDLERVAESISKCRTQCEAMLAEAEATDGGIAETARKVLGLWEMLTEKVSHRLAVSAAGLPLGLDDQL